MNSILQENKLRLLHDNALRQASLRRVFDPVSGEGSVGARFEVRVGAERLFLPETMRGEEIVEVLLRCGSFIAAGRALGISESEFKTRLHRLRCLHDFPYWAATCVYIKSKGGGGDVLFRLNAPQRRLVERFEAQRVAGKPIRLILLKARQWGGSTCTQLYMAWLQLMHAVGLNSLIIAHQGAGTEEIKDMFDRMIGQYPEELLYMDREPGAKERRMERVGRSGAAFRIPARNCKVKTGSAERPDSCRGGDYNLVHLSEVAIWPKTKGKSPEDIVRSACGGILLAPMTMIVYESTANGTGNFFHREYVAAARGESQFAAMFVSWYEIERYSLALTAEGREALAQKLIEGKDDESSTARTESGAYLWRLWESGATLEAIAWYIEERKKYNDHADMAAEYPSNDIEAFVHSGCRVFDRYRVERLRSDCCSPKYRGEVESGDLDPNSLRNLKFEYMSGGGLEIWEMPEDGVRMRDRYVAAVDVGGRSAKADWSVITVFDRAGGESGDRIEVVAQWRGHCDIDLLAWRAARIAKFYDEALLIFESNTLETREASRMLDGDQLPYIMLQLRDAYDNLYVRVVDGDVVGGGVTTRLGFHTNVRTKPMVISTLVRVVREELYTERCEAALDEMLSYERRQNGSYGAIDGAHDDILMTRAIGLHVILHDMEPMVKSRVERGKSRVESRRSIEKVRPDLAF